MKLVVLLAISCTESVHMQKSSSQLQNVIDDNKQSRLNVEIFHIVYAHIPGVHIH